MRSDDTPKSKSKPRLRGAWNPPGKPGARLALGAGLLAGAAHPPLGLWLIAWVALVPLLLSLTNAARPRQALWRGYLFGWAYLGPACYWVGGTIVQWTGSPIGWAAWFGLILIEAGFYALWGLAAWGLSRRASGGWRVLAWAASWAILEWIRTLGDLSFPWLPLSHTQVGLRPILQIAEFTGGVGVSFLIVALNGALFYAWRERTPQTRRILAGAGALWAAALIYGVARMRVPEEGGCLTVAAMQPNAPMQAALEQRQSEWAKFARLTAQARAGQNPPTLYVWSESASPTDALHDLDAQIRFQDLAQESAAAVLVGARVYEPTTGSAYNAAVLFTPDSAAPRYYAKRQIVPFGEYIPYRSLFPAPIAQAFAFFQEDLARGTNPSLLRFSAPSGEVALGTFICFESVYPGLAREGTNAGANLLVTLTNDSWGASYAMMEQHYAAAVLRAIENRRALVRAANGGITCLLDSYGRERAIAPIRHERFAVAEVALRTERTLFTRFGDWFIGFCAAALVLGAVASRRVAPNAENFEKEERAS